MINIESNNSSMISSSFKIRIISRSFFPFAVKEPSLSICIRSVFISNPISESVALIIHCPFCVWKKI